MPYPDDMPLEDRRDLALSEMQRYGREDFIFTRMFSPRDSVYNGPMWGVSLPELENAYKAGWQQAERDYLQKGATLFYLHELLARMRTGDEWYGTGFDEPIALVEKAIAGLNKKGVEYVEASEM